MKNIKALEEKRDSTADALKEVEPNVQDTKCKHDWQPDGQTLTAVRYTCTKCKKSEWGGIDI